MNTITFTFVNEPDQQNYRDLIDYVASQCKFVSMIVRHTVPLDKSGADTLTLLEPFLKERSERSEWPGTILFRGTAIMYTYNLVSAVVKILKSSADRLYEWEQPKLPEDLSFLNERMVPFLYTISHERDSVVCFVNDQLSDLEKKYPSLAKMLMSE